MGGDETADQSVPDEIRSPEEVARRTLALFGVVGIALGTPRNDVMAWLLENDLWKDLTPLEQGFLDTATPSKKAMINASWYTERLIVLLWSLGLISKLPRGDEQCDVACFQELLPPYSNVEVAGFIRSASLRSNDELRQMADECVNLHWEGRSAKLENRKPRLPVDTEIIQERHHAINWVTGYDGLPWDEVTTDT